MADLTGEVIDGRYQLTRIVDAGGMATIYAALDLRLDREVAVKIMHPHLANDENYVSRFIREAKAAASRSRICGQFALSLRSGMSAASPRRSSSSR